MEEVTNSKVEVWLRLKPFIKTNSLRSKVNETAKSTSVSSRRSLISPRRSTNFEVSPTPIDRSPLDRPKSPKPSEHDFKALTVVKGNYLTFDDRVDFQGRNSKEFNNTYFPNIFGERESNKRIFKTAVIDKLESSIAGARSSTVMTYGISGSGKTHTIFGSKLRSGEWENGILYHAIEFLFQQQGKTVSSIDINFVEIYNENIYDLFSDNENKKLALVSSGEGVDVKDVRSINIKTLDQVFILLKEAEQKRIVCNSTNNKVSSRYCIMLILRSHAMIQLNIKLPDKRGFVFRFVDLAGSEKVDNRFILGIHERERYNA